MSTQEVLDNIKYVAWHSIEVVRESRADMPVEVDICDDQDQSVFHGTFSYALRPRN